MNDMDTTWCCPSCGELYDLSECPNLEGMNKCCRYWMRREAFNKYRQKYNASRAEK